MIIARGRLSYPTFKIGLFNAALRAAAETQVRQAAREWLRAVIPLVPVWTGTARGTLQPLGRFLRIAVPISPVAVRKGMGPDVGASMTRPYYFNRVGDRFYFRFNTDVAHFIQNEFYNAPNPPFRLRHPTPWNAVEAGNRAFEAYLRTTLPQRIPKLRDYFKYKVVRIEPGN